VAGGIVVGYDGLDGGQAALDAAIDLATRLGEPLMVAYGYHVTRLGGEVADMAHALVEQAEKVTSEGAERARQAGIDAQAVVREGDPATVLAQLAGELQATMIALGTRGERPLTAALIGSPTHKLLHESPVPVLAVPH
jgi:nucleotide-binding universal stress UspA family protein